eukprot:gene10900-3604_t
MPEKDFRVRQVSISPFQQHVMKGTFKNFGKKILYRIKTIGGPAVVPFLMYAWAYNKFHEERRKFVVSERP